MAWTQFKDFARRFDKVSIGNKSCLPNISSDNTVQRLLPLLLSEYRDARVTVPQLMCTWLRVRSEGLGKDKNLPGLGLEYISQNLDDEAEPALTGSAMWNEA